MHPSRSLVFAALALTACQPATPGGPTPSTPPASSAAPTASPAASSGASPAASPGASPAASAAPAAAAVQVSLRIDGVEVPVAPKAVNYDAVPAGYKPGPSTQQWYLGRDKTSSGLEALAAGQNGVRLWFVLKGDQASPGFAAPTFDLTVAPHMVHIDRGTTPGANYQWTDAKNPLTGTIKRDADGVSVTAKGTLEKIVGPADAPKTIAFELTASGLPAPK